MLTQSTTPAAPQTAAPKTFWRRADEITGFILFLLIMVGGVVAPFALYIYGLLFR